MSTGADGPNRSGTGGGRDRERPRARGGPGAPPRTPKSPPRSATSPRIERLRAALGAGEGEPAVDRFWAQAQREGTPLVDVLEGEPRNRIVTFLWRDRHGTNPGTRAVLLMANKLTDPSVWAQSILERLQGSDVWHRSYVLRSDWRASYQLAPDDEQAARQRDHGGDSGLVPGARGRWRGFDGQAGPDPLNRELLPALGRGAPSSVAELPDAPPQPWFRRRPGVPRGTVSEHRIASAALGDTRRVWAYVPPGWAPHRGPYPVAVLLDGAQWAGRLDAAATLDNLIAERRIAPTVALMPELVHRQELGCHEPFVRFLTTELLAWAAEHHAATRNPARTILAGHSLSALAAAHAALLAPAHFGNVLAQSASLWWPGEQEPDIPGDWLMRQFVTSPRRAVRFHLRAGLQEWILLPLHRHLRDVLEAKGYDVELVEYYGGHDVACWRGGLAEGLIALAG